MLSRSSILPPPIPSGATPVPLAGFLQLLGSIRRLIRDLPMGENVEQSAMPPKMSEMGSASVRLKILLSVIEKREGDVFSQKASAFPSDWTSSNVEVV